VTGQPSLVTSTFGVVAWRGSLC